MKDIVNLPKWIYLLEVEKISRTSCLVFVMFYCDSITFSSGPTLIARKFLGRIARPHVQRAYKELEQCGFFRKTGEIMPNKRGKGTPVYVIDERKLEIFKDHQDWYIKDQAQRPGNVPKDNVPVSVDSAVGTRLPDVETEQKS